MLFTYHVKIRESAVNANLAWTCCRRWPRSPHKIDSGDDTSPQTLGTPYGSPYHCLRVFAESQQWSWSPVTIARSTTSVRHCVNFLVLGVGLIECGWGNHKCRASTAPMCETQDNLVCSAAGFIFMHGISINITNTLLQIESGIVCFSRESLSLLYAKLCTETLFSPLSSWKSFHQPNYILW